MRIVRYIAVILLSVMPLVSRGLGYSGVYYDPQTTTLLKGTMLAQLQQENDAADYIEKILKSYGKANVALTGIYITKSLERKALHDAGLLSINGAENYYYQHIYKRVYEGIIPQIMRVGVLLIDHFDQVHIWGPQLYEICEDVRLLCGQFSAVCSNGTLTFNFDFPQIADEVLEIVGLKDLSSIDWQDFFDDLSSIDFRGTADDLVEDVKSDFDDLYSSGQGLYQVASGGLDSLWAGRGRVGALFNGKPREVKSKIDSLKTFFAQVTDTFDVKSKVTDFMGTIDTLTVLTKFFKYRSCDPMEFIHDFSQDLNRKAYYRERWYIHDYYGNVVYEEWYDSYNMSEEAFRERMETKLDEYNDPDRLWYDRSSYYFLSQDQRTPYTTTEELKMEGVNQAVFTLSCNEGGNMGEGSHTFKVNKRHHDPLCEESKTICMETHLSDADNGASDKRLAEDNVSYWTGQYSTYESEYNDYQSTINDLYALFGQGQLTYEGEDIQTLINGYAKKRDKAGDNRDAARDSLNKWTAVYEDVLEDMSDDGDVFRIPHIQNMFAGQFGLTWLDDGHWEGYTWVRKAHSSHAGRDVTLRVKLERARGESWFLGIRTHRSKITMEYKLTYEAPSENIIEYLDLDPSQGEAANRNTIEEHRRNWQSQFPECTVYVETKVQEGLKDSIDDHKVHLLWASDRIRVARDISGRLELIYARLQVMERQLLYSKSFLNRVADEVHNIVSDPLDAVWCYDFLNERNQRLRDNVNAAPLRRRQGSYIE